MIFAKEGKKHIDMQNPLGALEEGSTQNASEVYIT
jgi:hypothetical protein